MLTSVRMILFTATLMVIPCSAGMRVGKAISAVGRGFASASGSLVHGGAEITQEIIVAAPAGVGLAAVKGGAVALFATAYFMAEQETQVGYAITRSAVSSGAAAGADLVVGVSRGVWYLMPVHRKRKR
jgi:hypothetical protein